MIRRLIAVATVALVVSGLAPAAGADDVQLEDPENDVVLAESGTPTTEPRVDILAVDVTNEARLLEIAVTVSQFVPLEDPAWDASLGFQAAIAGESDEDFFLWTLIPDGSGGATGELLSFTDFFDFSACETEASAIAETKQYILSAGPECLRDVPRSVRVGAALVYDAVPNDDTFDVPIDMAPDSELSDLIGSSGGPDVLRIAGENRIATAIAMSQDSFDDATAFAAVLASSDDYPDAIAGGPLATSRGGPLLLTGGDELDPRVADELARAVEPGSEVFVLGGSGVIGDRVVTGLRELGFRPRRLAGATRFETAVAIADEIGEHTITMVADGRSFRDGLVAGAAAASLGGVVVLTDGGTLPTVTNDYLANDEARHVAIGTAAAAAPGAERIVAGSTAELSQKVLDRLLPNVSMIAVAGQSTYADALAGAPHLAALGGGLLLTDSDSLSASTGTELAQRADDVREVVLYGGTAAISAGVEDAIKKTVGGS